MLEETASGKKDPISLTNLVSPPSPRESVATFLTRGDLWISWVWGKDSFEEYMLDFEPSLSCGCWMRSSCSAFVTGPVEHYCPVTFGQKIDPQGLFIRAYIPELRNFPCECVQLRWMQ